MDETEAKIEELFKSKYKLIRYFAYSYLGDMDLAENVAQDTFVKLWQNRDNVYFDKGTVNYLLVIARNLCLNQLRSDKQRGNYEDFALRKAVNDFNIAALEDSTSLSLYSDEIRKLYGEALTKMTDKVRETFILSREKGLTYNEIAALSGVTPKAVENRMSTALKVLREYLKDFLPILLGYLALWVF
jgi:RNA polymerase sigma-70 factor (ECF subfamily)